MKLVAKDVAAYLREHPEFFDQYADVLEQLALPDPHGGRAVSISERQVGGLRDKVKRLEHKLSELIRFGEENDVLLAKTHRLVVAITGAGVVEKVLQALYTHLGEDFEVPHVTVRLWDAANRLPLPEFAPMSGDARVFAASLPRPWCGVGSGPEMLDWFAAAQEQVRSLALVPLRRGTLTFGLLALGSEEPRRFYPEMGTLYLERIGDVASAALARTLLD